MNGRRLRHKLAKDMLEQGLEGLSRRRAKEEAYKARKMAVERLKVERALRDLKED